MALEPLIIARAAQLFRDKGWNVNNEIDETFDRFCSTLAFLTPEQREMILDLTDNFLKVVDRDYSPRIRSILQGMHEGKRYKEIDHFYVVPLLKPDDAGTGAKSGPKVSYLFHQPYLAEHPIFRKKRLTVVKHYESLPKDFSGKQALLLIVDDFIGSGTSALAALADLKNMTKFTDDKILFLTIVIQSQGYEALQNSGLSVACDEIRNKGISDNSNHETRDLYLDLMTEIETLLTIDAEQRFGYRHSEALVSMIHTPNNTFPVYWERKRLLNGQAFVGTFPRNY